MKVNLQMKFGPELLKLITWRGGLSTGEGTGTGGCTRPRPIAREATGSLHALIGDSLVLCVERVKKKKRAVKFEDLWEEGEPRSVDVREREGDDREVKSTGVPEVRRKDSILRTFSGEPRAIETVQAYLPLNKEDQSVESNGALQGSASEGVDCGVVDEGAGCATRPGDLEAQG